MPKSTKDQLAESIALHTFKVSKYSARLKIRARIDDPDEMARVTLYLNGPVVDWIHALHSEWTWVVFRAAELKTVKTMGDFKAICEAHLLEAS